MITFVEIEVFMKRLVLVLLLLVGLSLPSFSQTKVIVSEYNNVSGSPIGEWVELLVIEDNVNIVGFYLRDNSGTGDWQGGIVFNDVALWKNLRKGTVILIQTRGFAAVDADASDGFVDIQAENPIYFSKRTEPGVVDWTGTFNFNQTTECLQLLDNNNVHHHALAQSTTPVLTAIAVLPAPKVVHQDDAISQAVRFWGFGGGAYNQANGTDSTSNNSVGSRGLANGGNPARPQEQDINQRYWRAIRQPVWNSPVINEQPVNGGVRLTWNPATDPFPSDSVQGYLITRHLKIESAGATLPIDSYFYPVGAKLGTADVMANIKGSTITEYIDKSIACDESYIYRIFAYRYTNTGDNTDNNPSYGRGRSYNETSYAEKEVKVVGIQPATISVVGSSMVVCSEDVIKIAAIVPPGDYEYEWQINGVVHSQDENDTLTVTVKKGVFAYRLKLTNAAGCISYSNVIQVEGVEPPNAYLARIEGAKETKILKNENITLCKGQTLKLNGTGGSAAPTIKVEWFKDNALWKSAQNVVDITEAGVYYFIATNNGACPDTSFKVTVEIKDFNFVLDQSSLDFIVPTTESFIEKTIVLTNNASEALTITQSMLVIPFAYTIVTPTFPQTIAPSKTLSITIRFTPPDFGIYSGRIIITSPCGSKFVNVKGYKDVGVPTLSAGNSNINLGTKLECESEKLDSIITVTALGNEEILLGTPTISNSSFSISFSSGSSINPFETFTLTATLEETAKGTYSAQIKVPYKGKSQTSAYDTLRLSISAEIIKPELTLSSNEMDLGILTGCQASKDSILYVTNNSGTEITISNQPSDSRVVLKNLPITIPNGESLVAVEFTFTASTSNEDFILQLPFEPCASNIDIRFKAEHKGMVFSFDKNAVNFGDVFKCGMMVEVQENVGLNIANFNNTAKVRSVVNSNPTAFIVTGVQNGDVLSPTTNINIMLSMATSGNQTGELTIVFEPCGNTLVLPLSANLLEMNYTINGLSNETLDFGKTDAGVLKEKTITIDNNTSSPLIINNIENLVSPFSLVDPASLPIIVPPNTTAFPIKFGYTNTMNDAVDVAELTFKISSPCDINRKITFGGQTSKGAISLKARLELPAVKVTAEPGKTAAFTLSLFSKSSDPFSASEISKFSFILKYNSTLLYPKSIRAIGAFANNQATIKQEEKVGGELTITIEPTDMTKFTDGEIAYVEFTALLGNSISTKVTISEITIESPNDIEMEVTDGEFELVGGCMLSRRLLQVGEKPAIILPKGNVFGDRLELEINHIVDSYAKVTVYNSAGLEMTKYSDKQTAGKLGLNFDSSRFASGFYMIVYEYDGGIITEKVVKE